jgi:hypothetical protein
MKRTGRFETILVVIQYAWKQHKESPCIAIYTQTSQNATFFLLSFMYFLYKIRGQEGRTRVGVGDGLALEEGRRKWWEDECDDNNVYKCM